VAGNGASAWRGKARKAPDGLHSTQQQGLQLVSLALQRRCLELRFVIALDRDGLVTGADATAGSTRAGLPTVLSTVLPTPTSTTTGATTTTLVMARTVVVVLIPGSTPGLE